MLLLFCHVILIVALYPKIYMLYSESGVLVLHAESGDLYYITFTG